MSKKEEPFVEPDPNDKGFWNAFFTANSLANDATTKKAEARNAAEAKKRKAVAKKKPAAKK